MPSVTPDGARCESRGPPRKPSEPVGAPGGPAVQRLLLLGRGLRGEPLERVPERRVADAHLLDGKVALEHAALRTELLDARLDVWAPVVGELRGRRRRGQ